MSTLLVIQSSLFSQDGHSSKLASAYVQHWTEHNPAGSIVRRDLGLDPIPHLTAEGLLGLGLAPADRSTGQQQTADLSDSLINELRMADEILIALPMYNFTLPSSFKAWMDHVARVGMTFKYTERGAVGLLEDRPVTVIATRGGLYQGTPLDTQTPLINTFFGFIGLQSVRFIYAEGLAMGPQSAEQALQQAQQQIQAQFLKEVA
jgi:FMN-dependent NADH-azoreductase